LRDSGSLQSLIARNKICDLDFTDTGEFRLIKGVTGDAIPVPLVEVNLQSKFGTGPYLFGLVDSLPDETFDALVGNDLDPPRFHDPSLSVNAVTRTQTAALRSAVTDQKPVHPAETPVLSPTPSPNQSLLDRSDEAVKVLLDSSNDVIQLQHLLSICLILHEMSPWPQIICHSLSSKMAFFCALGGTKTCPHL